MIYDSLWRFLVALAEADTDRNSISFQFGLTTLHLHPGGGRKVGARRTRSMTFEILLPCAATSQQHGGANMAMQAG
ncbi:MAG: hypothetical protein ABI606_07915 [Rhodoferax sp.]